MHELQQRPEACTLLPGSATDRLRYPTYSSDLLHKKVGDRQSMSMRCSWAEQGQHLDDSVCIIILGHEHFVHDAGLARGRLPGDRHAFVGRGPMLGRHVLGGRGALLVDEDVPGSHHLTHRGDAVSVEGLVPSRCTRLHSPDRRWALLDADS